MSEATTSIAPRGWKLWWLGARPRTLTAAIAPVVVGTAAASTGASSIVWWRAIAALIVALAIQIGTNFANDYSDGKRGTDAQRVGPLRLTASGLVPPARVKLAAALSFLVAAVAGLALAMAVNYWLIAVGALAFVAAVTYTGGPKPYGYAGFGELAVLVFFGFVATVGSAYVHRGRIPAVAWPGAVAVGLWACAILLANNVRDVWTDLAAGKRTLAVRIGDRPARWLFVAVLVIPFAVIAAVGIARPWALLALVGLPLAIAPARTMLAGRTGRELIAVLAASARVQLVGSIAFALGLWLSSR